MDRGELLELLRDVEWSDRGFCPCCNASSRPAVRVHQPGCRLARAIGELAGLPGELIIREGTVKKSTNDGSPSPRPKAPRAQSAGVLDADLETAVRDYLSEMDNPVPDALYRRVLRDHLRKLVGAPPAQAR